MRGHGGERGVGGGVDPVELRGVGVLEGDLHQEAGGPEGLVGHRVAVDRREQVVDAVVGVGVALGVEPIGDRRGEHVVGRPQPGA